MRNIVIVVTAMTIGMAPAWAYRTGTAAASRSGATTLIDIPIEMAQGEELISATIAPASTYDVLKQPRPNIFKSAKVSKVQSDTQTVIRIEGGEAAASGGRIAVVLDVMTNTGQSMRQVLADIPPKEVKAAPPPHVARQVVAPVNPADPLLRASAFDSQMNELNMSIAAITVQVKSLADTMTADLQKQAARDAAAAQRDAAILAALQPKQSESQQEEFILLGIAAVMGAGLAGVYLAGRKERFSPGARLHLTRLDGLTVEAEFVNVQTASHDKALPYRIADILTGAPRHVLIRQIDEPAAETVFADSNVIDYPGATGGSTSKAGATKPHVKLGAYNADHRQMETTGAT